VRRERRRNEHHVLCLNLKAEPKPIALPGKATGLLGDARYDGGFTLGAFDAEFAEFD
jgi:hypothetical protein